MPGGFTRLNARQSQIPNNDIGFIKPLPGPDSAIAQDFLERVAAICAPITKAAHLAVRTLEEHEPNREFVGRNFNAGEIIQLVLKSRSGRWLPFEYVSMVMMHELAHCLHMNHKAGFWAVRNQYAAELRELWRRGYTGEGIWGRGQSLYDGQYTSSAMPEAADMPEQLCGGTYRKWTRKRKPTLTYAEQKERRILKKFGAGGVALGDDELARRELEKKRVKSKPRVAQSMRGRELRAAAALARLDQSAANGALASTKSGTGGGKITDFTTSRPNVDDDDDESSWDLDDEENKPDVTIGDEQFIKNEEDDEPSFAQNELADLYMPHNGCGLVSRASNGENDPVNPKEDDASETESEPDLEEARLLASMDDIPLCPDLPSPRSPASPPPSTHPRPKPPINPPNQDCPQAKPINNPPAHPPKQPAPPHAQPPTPTALAQAPASTPTPQTTCPICSLTNSPNAPTCLACAHVLDTRLLPDHWVCRDAECRATGYVNAGDVGVCGLCGMGRGAGKGTDGVTGGMIGAG